jgi:hypothetical protein
MEPKVVLPKPIIMNHRHCNNLIYYLFQAYLFNPFTLCLYMAMKDLT